MTALQSEDEAWGVSPSLCLGWDKADYIAPPLAGAPGRPPSGLTCLPVALSLWFASANTLSSEACSLTPYSLAFPELLLYISPACPTGHWVMCLIVKHMEKCQGNVHSGGGVRMRHVQEASDHGERTLNQDKDVS